MTVPTLSVLIEGSERVTDTLFLSFTRGLNFEGGLANDQATLTLTNIDTAYSVGAAVIHVTDEVHVRATYSGTVYGLFYGRVMRVGLDPVGRTAMLTVQGVGSYWGTNVEVDIASSSTRSIAAFRGLILDAVSAAANQRSLSLHEAEADIPVTVAEKASAQQLLAALDASTLTLSYAQPSNDTGIRVVYTTLPRMDRATQAVAEAFPDEWVSYNVSIDAERRVTSQRVWFGDESAWVGPSPLDQLDREGNSVDAVYAPSLAAAAGVAEYLVVQGQEGEDMYLGTFTTVNHFPSQLVRKVGERVTATPARVSGLVEGTIDSITTDIDMAAARWTTTYSIGPIIGGILGVYFVLGTSVLDGAQVTGY